MSPVSSATGMKSAGPITRPPGRVQRTNASRPQMSDESSSTIGW